MEILGAILASLCLLAVGGVIIVFAWIEGSPSGGSGDEYETYRRARGIEDPPRKRH